MSSANEGRTMQVNHIHAPVRDLPAALEWLENVFEIRPSFRDDRMAAVPFGSFTVIFGAALRSAFCRAFRRQTGKERENLVMHTLAMLAGLAVFFRLPETGALETQPPVEGQWEGSMLREGSALPVSFDFMADVTGVLRGEYSSPAQRALGIPFDVIEFDPPKLHAILDGAIVFEGELSGSVIEGA